MAVLVLCLSPFSDDFEGSPEIHQRCPEIHQEIPKEREEKQ